MRHSHVVEYGHKQCVYPANGTSEQCRILENFPQLFFQNVLVVGGACAQFCKALEQGLVVRGNGDAPYVTHDGDGCQHDDEDVQAEHDVNGYLLHIFLTYLHDEARRVFPVVRSVLHVL